MLLSAMVDNQADGCAMLEAHEDPEVVRLRLGKALDFEYNEVSLSAFGLHQARRGEQSSTDARAVPRGIVRTRSRGCSRDAIHARQGQSSTLSGRSQSSKRSVASLTRSNRQAAQRDRVVGVFESAAVLTAASPLPQVAIRERKKRNRPLVLIVQNAHFIHDVSVPRTRTG